ncbi:MAG: TlpA disulfide reductase family protein [Candidatus Sulfotelmatobacter sp.]
MPSFFSFRIHVIAGALVVGASLMGSCVVLSAQQNKVVWSEQEKPIVEQLQGLRKLDDKTRIQVTKQLAVQIRQLPPLPHKLGLAGALANLSTEGDFGRDTLQEVTTTLAMALREQPARPEKDGSPNHHYMELASLVRYEHMKAESNDPQFAEAVAQLQAADEARQNADFTLSDLEGESWHLQELRGKVVLVNFWATWCPPCRKEMPDLQALFDKYKSQGLIVLSISDEEAAKVAPFIKQENITYPVMLDPGGKVHKLYQVEGIPKSFVYNRDGQLVAQSIDMRTRSQFEEMLAQAGLK